MKKFIIVMLRWIANPPMTALILGAIVGVSLPPYTHPLSAEIGRSVFSFIVVMSGWLLARWIARKTLDKKGISYDR